MIERVRWQCPECGRKFEIPTGHDPDRCIICQEQDEMPVINDPSPVAAAERRYRKRRSEFLIKGITLLVSVALGGLTAVWLVKRMPELRIRIEVADQGADHGEEVVLPAGQPPVEQFRQPPAQRDAEPPLPPPLRFREPEERNVQLPQQQPVNGGQPAAGDDDLMDFLDQDFPLIVPLAGERGAPAADEDATDPKPQPEIDPADAKALAIAAIHRQGGKVEIDVKRKDRPVTKVHLELRYFNDEHMKHLAALEDVEFLDLRSNRITEAGVRHVGGLHNLETLLLGGNSVRDGGLEHLKELSGLTALDLSRTSITDAGLIHLQPLAKLEKLDLYDTRITDAGLEHLKPLARLQYLNLNQTAVRGPGLVHLRDLTRLEGLFLSGPLVTDSTLEHVSQLPRLRALTLVRTGVSDAGIVHLKRLRRLEALNLGSTQVSDEGLRDLRKSLPRLKVARN